MKIEDLGFPDLPMMDGESVDRALNLGDPKSGGASGAADVVLLTDKRVIHLKGGGRKRKAVFIPLADVSAAEVATERSGYGGYVWGGLAFLVAWLVWGVWDHPLGSAVAAAAVVLMGVYLIVDQIYAPGIVRATFKTGSLELSCGTRGAGASGEVYEFVNRLFQLKGRDTEAEPEDEPVRAFAPR